MPRFRCTFELEESGEVRTVEVLAGHHTEVDDILDEYVSLVVGSPPAHRGHRLMEVEALAGPVWGSQSPPAPPGLVRRSLVRVVSTLSVALRAVWRG